MKITKEKMKYVEDDKEVWPTDGEFPEEWIRRAHDTLMQGGGMLGVVYRRQVNRNRELRNALSQGQREDSAHGEGR